MRRLLGALLLVVAACGGGDDDDGGDAAADRSTTSTTVADEVGTTTPAGDAGAPATTAPSAGPTTTGVAGGDAGPAATAGPAPIAPGTYTFRQTGSASGGGQTFETPPEGTMVVDAAGADGRQQTHRYIDPEGEPVDTTLLFDDRGMFIVETVLRQGGAEITCTFDPPVPTPPWPPDVGKTFEGTGDCGVFTADVTGSITGTRTVQLDGTTYDAVVVESTVKTTGQFESESQQIDWFVPELRLSAHTDTESNGKFGQVTFTSSGTSDLVSAVPA